MNIQVKGIQLIKSLGSTVLALITLFIMTSTVLSCASETKVYSVDGIIDLLKDNGYSVGERSEEHVLYVWAADGGGLKVNGHQVVIYEYETPKILRSKGLKAIDVILEIGTGFWEMNLNSEEKPYFYKKNMLILLGDHPDSSRIRALLDENL